ncbi:concanavalin A-like lectin/glucanase [Backusella circina FSU 941]|nr:concanavalin A-like lectin/glucanase [Backusella circina FSU 941]
MNSHLSTVLRYEDPSLLEYTLDMIPIQQFYDEIEGEDDDLQDELVKRLLHWFKNEFFSWVDVAPCDYCGSKQTRATGYADPTSEDISLGAHVVETSQCHQCFKTTRFPRYNDPKKLLQTRRGRCGEWANCFTLCCRAIGSEARLVFDKTDHVWTEVYSENEQRWVHCDSCEEAWDRPLMYSVGWNKKLNYCIGFSVDGVMDVTKRYVKNWPEVLKRRTLISEQDLQECTRRLTAKCQTHFDKDKMTSLKERQDKEQLELNELVVKGIAKQDEMMGRQSGSLAWRSMRGETKTSKSMEDLHWAPLRELNTSTKDDFVFVGDASITLQQEIFIGRLTRSTSSQTGAMYLKQPVDLSELKGLEVDFKFRITDGEGKAAVNGADGFAFVIQSNGPDALGEGGCELGYGGLKNSLAIEFDTYQSSDRCDDPSSNHISIHGRLPPHKNSAHHNYSLGHTSHIPLLGSGEWIKARIRIESNRISVGLGESSDTEYLQVLEVQINPLLKYLNYPHLDTAWLGFTAGTGGLSQNHDVKVESVKVYHHKKN